KIVGIGLVGLTQFALWLLLSGILFTAASALISNPADLQETMQSASGTDLNQISQSSPQAAKIMASLESINFPELILTFFIFFFGGYLIYSALFAAVGSAVDSETEPNQFTLPITMPLLLTYMLSFGVLVNDPNGAIATWLSFIPFTSPIAMIVRVPFGVPTWQILVSAVLLIGGFLATTWVAARIYRVVILMHDKKASCGELMKWFNYKGQKHTTSNAKHDVLSVFQKVYSLGPRRRNPLNDLCHLSPHYCKFAFGRFIKRFVGHTYRI